MPKSIIIFFLIICITATVLAGCTSTPQNSVPETSATQTGIPQTSVMQTSAPQSQEEKNIATIKGIVEEYHKTHTYSLIDMYVCSQMAQDVWDMVKTQGINATIEIGNVTQNITTVQESTHAWVLAEVSPGEWIAMETTGGYLVCGTPATCAVNNPLYYKGWNFNNPKELQDYLKNGPCSAGYIVGSDNLCHQTCGVNSYCTDNEVCVNGQCHGCSTGYIFGADLQCHPACGNTYCTGNGVCVSGECRSCEAGYILGNDNLCHLACGVSTYCTGNSSACVNGQCISCNKSYYLGTDLQCHKS
jgi:hypothetical protein